MTRVGKIITDWLEVHGRSQNWLADKVGTSPATISYLMRGQVRSVNQGGNHYPLYGSPDRIKRIAKALDLDESHCRDLHLAAARDRGYLI